MEVSNETSLVIMAAGIGSRFGGGIKQLEPVGPNGEIIMDYSIMMLLPLVSTKLSLLSVRILKKTSEKLLGIVLKKSQRNMM